MKDENPVQFPADRSFTYGVKTSNMPKSGHIKKFHLNLYLEEAEKNGWTIWLENVKKTFNAGYSFQTLREALAALSATLQSLPPLTQGACYMS